MGWGLKDTREQEWLPARIPGCVHTDLLRNDKIEAPYYGINEHRLQGIDKRNWKYETAFDAEELPGESDGRLRCRTGGQPD